jgi:hypothetical protein
MCPGPPLRLLQVLTGPNCSGKTTYLKQAAILTVMSHLGCHVPAAVASFRLTDRICTRLGTDDDMESNASTFLKEMKETAFILSNVSELLWEVEGSKCRVRVWGRSRATSDVVFPTCSGSVSRYHR